ncbi:hypothetical protein DFH06DRAFT_1473456 [Mycena polygramma]|nr:hypothetical protein DFH06DRAFT_1473456 [Mycena polygramma]
MVSSTVHTPTPSSRFLYCLRAPPDTLLPLPPSRAPRRLFFITLHLRPRSPLPASRFPLPAIPLYYPSPPLRAFRSLSPSLPPFPPSPNFPAAAAVFASPSICRSYVYVPFRTIPPPALVSFCISAIPLSSSLCSLVAHCTLRVPFGSISIPHLPWCPVASAPSSIRLPSTLIPPLVLRPFLSLSSIISPPCSSSCLRCLSGLILCFVSRATRSSLPSLIASPAPPPPCTVVTYTTSPLIPFLLHSSTLSSSLLPRLPLRPSPLRLRRAPFFSLLSAAILVPYAGLSHPPLSMLAYLFLLCHPSSTGRGALEGGERISDNNGSAKRWKSLAGVAAKSTLNFPVSFAAAPALQESVERVPKSTTEDRDPWGMLRRQ